MGRTFYVVAALFLFCSVSFSLAGGAKVYEIDNYGRVTESTKRQSGLFRPPGDMDQDYDNNQRPSTMPPAPLGIVNPQRVWRRPKDEGVPGYIRKTARELMRRFDHRTRAFPQLQIPKRTMADVLVHIATRATDPAYVEGALTALPELYLPLNNRTRLLKGDYQDMAVVDEIFIDAVLKHIDSPITEVRYAALRATRPIVRSKPSSAKLLAAIRDLIQKHPDGETRRLGIYALFALEEPDLQTLDTLEQAFGDSYSLVVLAALQKVSWDLKRGMEYPDRKKSSLSRAVKKLERHSDSKVAATAATTQLLIKTPRQNLQGTVGRRRNTITRRRR